MPAEPDPRAGYLSQVDPQAIGAILGNVGPKISLRLGPADAAVLEKEFAPGVRVLDPVGLPNYLIHLKLMINGKVSRLFSAETMMAHESFKHYRLTNQPS